MSNGEPTKQEIIDMIMYITQTVPDVSHQDHKEILRIIQKSGIDDSKVQKKGGGTQVKFKDMQYETIVNIHTFLTKKIVSKMDKLASLTEEPISGAE